MFEDVATGPWAVSPGSAGVATAAGEENIRKRLPTDVGGPDMDVREDPWCEAMPCPAGVSVTLGVETSAAVCVFANSDVEGVAGPEKNVFRLLDRYDPQEEA